MAERGRILLASASPRRRELLARLGLIFEVAPADIDETELVGEEPVAYVHRLAIGKAAVPCAEFADIVIAADTTVDVDGEIFAKPHDDDDARRMLRLLSDRTHAVHTGIAVRHQGRTEAMVATTTVTMTPIEDDRLEWYIATGEPPGKAGAYALQGAGSVLVERVEGSVTNVIGLPLTTLDHLLGRFGLSLTALADRGGTGV